MSGPKQVPAEDWEYMPRPGSIREVYDHRAKDCIHGVPLGFGCPLCASRQEANRKATRGKLWRRWSR